MKNFSGSIPSEFGRLKFARWMLLHEAGFSGAIPSEIGLVQNLTRFSVHGNQLLGIPSELGLLTNLKEASFGNMTGVLPHGLCGVDELEFVCGNVCGCTCSCEGNNRTDYPDRNDGNATMIGQQTNHTNIRR